MDPDDLILNCVGLLSDRRPFRRENTQRNVLNNATASETLTAIENYAPITFKTTSSSYFSLNEKVTI